MFVACWSVKGGSGTTVVAVSLALLGARRRSRRSSPWAGDGVGALLVDLAGDVPAAIGAAEPRGPGVADWLRAGPRVPPDGWGRLEVAAGPGLTFVPRGRGPLLDQERAEVLAAVLGADGRMVVVDCGLVPADPAAPGSVEVAVDVGAGPAPASTARGAMAANGTAAAAGPAGVRSRWPETAGASAPWPDDDAFGLRSSPAADVASVMAASATVSLLVLRPCYLALRRASAAPITPSGVVVVDEPGRALGVGDIEDVLGVPVVAEVPFDPAVARAVDSGVLAQRLPRGLERSLRDAA